jgi:hypothetical protein
MASRKVGLDPVVNALSRGRVTVGAWARAVRGIAYPDATSLEVSYQ